MSDDVFFYIYNYWCRYLRLTLIFVWPRALREELNFCFSRVFASFNEIFIIVGRMAAALSFFFLLGSRSTPVFWTNIYKCICPAHLNNVPGFYNLYYRVVPSSIFCFWGECQLGYSVHGYIYLISNIMHCWYLFYISFIYFSVFVYVLCTLVLSIWGGYSGARC